MTNGDYSLFNPTNRVGVIIEEVPWLILPRMMQVATDIYEDVQRRRASGGGEPSTGTSREEGQGWPPAARPVVGVLCRVGGGADLRLGMPVV